MPHANTTSSKATSQNAATDPISPNDQAREQHRGAHPEPRGYVAAKVQDATLAPPAAGEIADYMDEGEALGADGLRQGRNHSRRPAPTEAARGQGPKTRASNRRRMQGR